MSTDSTLPIAHPRPVMTHSFNRVNMNRRFLEEFYWLHAASASTFPMSTELATALQTHRSIVNNIETAATIYTRMDGNLNNKAPPSLRSFIV